MLQSIQIRGYRSLREFRLKLGRATVVTGGNGVGKSNVYRSLALLQRMAEGRFADSLADSCDAKKAEPVSHDGETRPKDLAGAKRAWSFE